MPTRTHDLSLKYINFHFYMGCDQACKDCYADAIKLKSSGGRNSPLMTTPWGLRKKIIDTITQYNPKRIIISGGNPILDPFIAETVFYIYRVSKTQVSIISNSWAFENNPSLQKESDKKFSLLNALRDRTATIWGKNAKQHDKICGFSGSYERLIPNLVKISEMGLPISIALNIVSTNKNDLFESIKALNDHGIFLSGRIFIQRVFPVSRAVKKKSKNVHLSIYDLNSVFNQIDKIENELNLSNIKISAALDSTPPYCLVDKKFWDKIEPYDWVKDRWALDIRGRLHLNSLLISDPKNSLLGKQPVYKFQNSLIGEIKEDPTVIKFYLREHLPKECISCNILSMCCGGSMTYNNQIFFKDQMLSIYSAIPQ